MNQLRSRSVGGGASLGNNLRVLGIMVCAAMAFVLVMGSASPVQAQNFGVRAGASGEPNQFYAGIHLRAAT
jgi:hypothetical protein